MEFLCEHNICDQRTWGRNTKETNLSQTIKHLQRNSIIDTKRPLSCLFKQLILSRYIGTYLELVFLSDKTSAHSKSPLPLWHRIRTLWAHFEIFEQIGLNFDFSTFWNFFLQQIFWRHCAAVNTVFAHQSILALSYYYTVTRSLNIISLAIN